MTEVLDDDSFAEGATVVAAPGPKKPNPVETDEDSFAEGARVVSSPAEVGPDDSFAEGAKVVSSPKGPVKARPPVPLYAGKPEGYEPRQPGFLEKAPTAPVPALAASHAPTNVVPQAFQPVPTGAASYVPPKPPGPELDPAALVPEPVKKVAGVVKKGAEILGKQVERQTGAARELAGKVAEGVFPGDPNIKGLAQGAADIVSIGADPRITYGFAAGHGAAKALLGPAAPFLDKGVAAGFGATGVMDFFKGADAYRKAETPEEKTEAVRQMTTGGGIAALIGAVPATDLFKQAANESIQARDVARGTNVRAARAPEAATRAGLLRDIGLEEGASDAEIASAIKKTIRQTHPDIPENAWDPYAQQRFQRAIEARDKMPAAGEEPVEPVPVPPKNVPQRIVEAGRALSNAVKLQDWEGAREALRILREPAAEEAPKVGQVSEREPLPQRPVPPEMRLGAPDDRTKRQGLPSQERVGKEPLENRPDDGRGGAPPETGGVVQGARPGQAQQALEPLPEAEVGRPPEAERVQGDAPADMEAQTKALLWHKDGPEPPTRFAPDGVEQVQTPTGTVWFRSDSGLTPDKVRGAASTVEGLGKLLEMPPGGRPAGDNPRVVAAFDADGNEVWAAEVSDKTRGRALKKAGEIAGKIGGTVREGTRQELVAGRQERGAPVPPPEQNGGFVATKQKPGFVGMFSDAEHGVDYEMHRLKDGRFSVVVKDRDSGNIVNGARIFDTLDKAEAHAKELFRKGRGAPVEETDDFAEGAKVVATPETPEPAKPAKKAKAKKPALAVDMNRQKVANHLKVTMGDGWEEELVGLDRAAMEYEAEGEGTKAEFWRDLAGSTIGAAPAPEPLHKPVEAPNVETGDLGKVVTGPDDVAITAEGGEIPYTWAFVNVHRLIPSHDAAGNPNPAYAREGETIQQRDRAKPDSIEQMSSIKSNPDPRRLAYAPSATDGAPIIRPDGRALTNGRTAGLQAAFKEGNAVRYRAGIAAEARRTGMSEEAIAEGMKDPESVLVRLAKSEYVNATDQTRLARDTNVGSGLKMTLTEQGRSDATVMMAPDSAADTSRVLALMPDDGNGNLRSPAYRPFVQAFSKTFVPKNEAAGLFSKEGDLTAEGELRVQAALVAAAYGDSPVVDRMLTGEGDETVALKKALLNAAPDFAVVNMRQKHGELEPFDVTRTIVEASEFINDMRASGRTLDSVLRPKYGELISATDRLSPEGLELVKLIDESKSAKGAKLLTGLFRELAKVAEAYGIAKDQGGLFGEGEIEKVPLPTFAEAFKIARENYETKREAEANTLGLDYGAGGEEEPGAGSATDQGDRGKPAPGDKTPPPDDQLAETGSLYGRRELLRRRSEAADRLAKEIDRRYEAGELDGIEEMEQRLEKIQGEDLSEEDYYGNGDRLGGLALGNVDNEDGRTSIEEELAASYARYLIAIEKSGQPTGREDWWRHDSDSALQHLRSIIEGSDDPAWREQRPAGTYSDEQILDAAKDAYERRKSLREKYKNARPGERDRVRAWGRERGIEIAEDEAGYARPKNPLLALHNTTPQGILAAEKLGGIPVPSLAVLPPGEPFEGYGPITLVGNRALIDPERDSRNKVFNSDAYTPNQPFPSRSINKRGLSAFQAEINKILEPKQYAEKFLLDSFDTPREDRLGDYIWKIANDRGMREAYFKAHGHDLSRLTPIPLLKQNGGRAEYDEYRDARWKREREIAKMHEKLKPADAIEKWVKGLLDKHEAFGPEFLRHGRSKRAYTLENVVAAMTGGGLRGKEHGMFFGIGASRAANARAFKSVGQMKKNYEALVDSKSFEAAKEGFEKDFHALETEIAHGYGRSDSAFDRLDDFSRTLRDTPRYGVHSALARNGYDSRKLDPDEIERVRWLADQLRQLPTEYFEAKPRRGVKLSEFSGAVVPADTEKAILESLKQQGVTDVRTYTSREEPGEYPTRADAVASFERALFEEGSGYGQGKLFPEATDERGTGGVRSADRGSSAEPVGPSLSERRAMALGGDAAGEGGLRGEGTGAGAGASLGDRAAARRAAEERADRVLSDLLARIKESVPGGIGADDPLVVSATVIADELRKKGFVSLIGYEMPNLEAAGVIAQITARSDFEISRILLTNDVGLVLDEIALSCRLPMSVYQGHPDVSNDAIIEQMKRVGATHCFELHGHPSGDPEPSGGDFNITRKRSEIPGYLGHAIIDHESFVVYPANPQSETDYTRHYLTPEQKATRPKLFKNPDETDSKDLGVRITTAVDLARLGIRMHTDEKSVTLVFSGGMTERPRFRDASGERFPKTNRVKAVATVPIEKFTDYAWAVRRFRAEMASHGANHLLAYHPGTGLTENELAKLVDVAADLFYTDNTISDFVLGSPRNSINNHFGADYDKQVRAGAIKKGAPGVTDTTRIPVRIADEPATYGWHPGDPLPEALVDAKKGRTELGLPSEVGTYPLRGGGHFHTKTGVITTPNGEKLQPGTAAHDWAKRYGFEGDWQAALDRKRGEPGEIAEAGADYGDTKSLRKRAFDRWFEGSVVTNDDGSPRVMYHGTRASEDFDTFDAGDNDYKPDLGSHFGTPEQANSIISTNEEALKERLKDEGTLKPLPQDEGRRIYPVYLSIKNPLRLVDMDSWKNYSAWKDNIPEKAKGIEGRLRDLAESYEKQQLQAEADGDNWDYGIAESEFLDDVKRLITEAGYDGIVYVNEHEAKEREEDSYIAFYPWQIKSATANKGTFSTEDPSILNEEGPGYGKNAAFEKWFGESRAVDEKGEPLVVYHGTPTPGFTKFEKGRGMGGPLGIWFASTGEAASAFARERFAGQGPGVYPVYLSVQRPMEYHGWSEFTDHVNKMNGSSIEDRVKALRRGLVSRGYDGVVIRGSNTDGGGLRDDWVAFDAKQIKSATGNRGTFEPNDPNILHEEPPAYGKEKKSALDYASRFAPGAARALRPRGPEDEVRLAASDPTAGIFSAIFASRAPKASKTSQLPSPTDSHDPEVERRMRGAEGIIAPTLIERVKKAASDLEHSFTRHFIELDTKESSTLALDADILRQLEGSPEYAKAVALDTLAYITEGLDKPAARLFTRILALRDLDRSIDDKLYEEKDLPFGYEDQEAVKRDLRRYEEMAKGDEAVAAALEKRDKYAHDLTTKLVDMELLPEEVLDDPRYYHRQVMAIVNQKEAAYVGTGSQDVRVHRKGFQKARTGGGDFNLRYQEAEFEWMAQSHALIAMREALDRLREGNDIKPGLEGQAKWANTLAIYGGIENYQRVQALKSEKAEIYTSSGIGGLESDEKKRIAAINAELEEIDPLKPFSDRIGWAIYDLGKKAEHGELDHAPANLQEAVDELRQSSEWEEFRGDSESELFFPLLGYLVSAGKAGSGEAAEIFKAIADRKKFMKTELGNEFKTWRDLIPEKHPLARNSRAVVWQPEKGSIFYRAQTLPERALDRFVEDMKEAPEAVIDREALEKLLGKAREALVVGGPKQEWVIPEGLAKTLDNWKGSGRERGLESIQATMLQGWKQWVLLNPARALRYNLNNQSGDLDVVLAAFPKALSGWAKAARDLWQYTVKEDKSDPALVAEMQRAMKLGVISSGLTVQEIPDINEAGPFKGLTSEDPNIVQKALETYWTGTKKTSTWRENTLRLAVFRYLENELKQGKKLYGASKAHEVDAIKDVSERAAKLTRELVGDYGNISVAGQWIRRLMPFYSWMEINAPRYVRLLKNASREGGGGGKGGSGGGGGGGRGARVAAIGAKKIAVNYAKLALFAPLLYGAIQAWNNLMFPEEENLLGSDRKRLRLILGRNEDGSIRTIRLQGALSDALEWFGAGNVVADAKDIASGRSTVKKKLKDVVTSPIDKIVGAWEPFSKTLFELAFGYKSYPSLFKEGSFQPGVSKIRDRWEHLSDVLWPAGALYRKVTGKPRRPAPEMGVPGAGPLLDALLVQRTDPGEAAYWYSRNLASKYLEEKLGKSASVGGPTGEAKDRSDALYYFKRACEWGDEKAAANWLVEYYKLGGTPKNMREAFVREHPLGGLPLGKRGAFLNGLSDKDRAIVESAVGWYEKGRERMRGVQADTPYTPRPKTVAAQ